MGKMWKIFFAVFMLCLLPAAAVSAAEDGTHIFFAAQSMNEADEIIVPVYVENLPEGEDGLCGTEFSFAYDTAHFSVKTDENGRPLLGTSSVMLVEDISKIDVSENGGIVSVSYVDFGAEGGSVLRDGPMFFFTLIPKNPDALWNSDDYYPLRFVPGSVNLIKYNGSGQSISFVGEAAEGLDTYIGGYNVYPTFETPETPDKIEFVKDASSVRVDGEKRVTDAAPYEKDGEVMLPVRYVAEAMGAEVCWEDASQTAALYFPYHSAHFDIDGGKVYINSKERADLPKAEEIDGRTYAAVSVFADIFGDVFKFLDEKGTITMTPLK